MSASALSRIERGLVPATSIVRLAQMHATVGLDLSARSYPGGAPLRDAGHAAFMSSFRALLHPSWRWATEVPLPIAGDQRAWDGLMALRTCRYGVEAEMAPHDAQALARRLQLKARDGAVDGVVLILPRTRTVRDFLAATMPLLALLFPVPGSRALELIAAGVDPGGSTIIVLDRKARLAA